MVWVHVGTRDDKPSFLSLGSLPVGRPDTTMGEAYVQVYLEELRLWRQDRHPDDQRQARPDSRPVIGALPD